MMRSSDWPVSATRSTPLSTCVVEVEISPLISFAASAERCASARTSEATTAKPRPASPARAASTPAFSASRLVWNAISSMTPMIWLISADDLRSVHRADRLAHHLAAVLGVVASGGRPSRACLAPSAVFRTVAVISFSAAAVSSRLAACCSVRRDRSSDAVAISWRPSGSAPMLPVTCSSVDRSLAEPR